MRKTLLGVLVLLLSSAGADAQPPQPGYAFINWNPTAGSAVMPASAGPPEPAPLGGPPAAAGYGPGPVAMPGMGMGGYPAEGGMTSGCGCGAASGGWGGSALGTERFWFSGGYLGGFLTRPRLATPLLTTGSVTDPRPGAIGQPNTAVAFGSDQYNFGALHGGWAEFGVNVNDRLYLEIRGMGFFPQETIYSASSDAAGSPLITRPVFNTLTGENGSFLTSSPAGIVGTTTINARSQLWGIESTARWLTRPTQYLTVEGLIGYRRLQLEEELSVRDVLTPLVANLTFLGMPVTPPSFVADLDRFRTSNKFNGVNVGGRFRWQSGYEWFALSMHGKVALGATHQTVDIAGASALFTPTGSQLAPGGVLAQTSNIGTYSRTVFGVVPEGGVSVILQPNRNVRILAGYSALYWNSVVRPGDQIDARVNPVLVPTDLNFGGPNPGAFPAFEFKSQGVWLQTLNVGLEFYY